MVLSTKINPQKIHITWVGVWSGTEKSSAYHPEESELTLSSLLFTLTEMFHWPDLFYLW